MRFGEHLENLWAEIAQLVEHATENRGVASSILALGTLGLKFGQYAGIVQLVEHLLAKEKVTGSSPVARSTGWIGCLVETLQKIADYFPKSAIFILGTIQPACVPRGGIMATWPSGKARVCKTLITGSNPVVAS